MTPRQIELARHALGLPNAKNRSYRNRFFAGPGHADYNDWNLMCVAGLAKYLRAGMFWLALDGARAALLPGETLDREDFPDNPVVP